MDEVEGGQNLNQRYIPSNKRFAMVSKPQHQLNIPVFYVFLIKFSVVTGPVFPHVDPFKRPVSTESAARAKPVNCRTMLEICTTAMQKPCFFQKWRFYARARAVALVMSTGGTLEEEVSEPAGATAWPLPY